MKLKFVLLIIFIHLILRDCFAQYIGVRARYTETRLIDDSPNPPKREDHLILSFYTVDPYGIYTPTVLSNYDIWLYKEGFQYGSFCGGVVDSCGNNYPGYSYTAPQAVAYYNSYHPNWIDCDGTVSTHYIVNGHELDCGFVNVSYWSDNGSGQLYESFTAPNICLPYYFPPDPYASMNYNFNWPIPPGGPYNWYSFYCNQSTQQLVIRGVLQHDTTLSTLPVKFVQVNAFVNAQHNVTIEWTNATESDISHYEVQRSTGGSIFTTVGKLIPMQNDGGNVSYQFTDYSAKKGVYYYRIAGVEISGEQQLSYIVQVQVTGETAFSFNVFPNPVDQHATIIMSDQLPREVYSISLIDANGQQYKVRDLTVSEGRREQLVSIPFVTPGVYQLVLRSPTHCITKTIFITH